LEKQGKWREASDTYRSILEEDPRDSHSHLGYARLEARRSTNSTSARQAFQTGTVLCPDSVHLWQAWAMYEHSCGKEERARALFEQALTLDDRNPYVCHAYGLMEKKLGNGHVSRYSIFRDGLCVLFWFFFRVPLDSFTYVMIMFSPFSDPYFDSSPNNYGNGHYWNDRRQL
jgi:Tfp pilus assembly protein PilF